MRIDRRFRSAGSGWDRFGGLVALSAVAIGCDAPASTSAPNSPPPAVAPLSPYAQVVRLDRGAHPLALPTHYLGRLDPARRLANLSLVFKPSAQQYRDRDAL